MLEQRTRKEAAGEGIGAKSRGSADENNGDTSAGRNATRDVNSNWRRDTESGQRKEQKQRHQIAMTSKLNPAERAADDAIGSSTERPEDSCDSQAKRTSKLAESVAKSHARQQQQQQQPELEQSSASAKGGAKDAAHRQSTAGIQPQKQMFSLKQLAINSRNLTKKRSLATNDQPLAAPGNPLVLIGGKQPVASRKSELFTRASGRTISRLLDQTNLRGSNSSSNSSSNCSAENSCASEAEQQHGAASRRRGGNRLRCGSSGAGKKEASKSEGDLRSELAGERSATNEEQSFAAIDDDQGSELEGGEENENADERENEDGHVYGDEGEEDDESEDDDQEDDYDDDDDDDDDEDDDDDDDGLDDSDASSGASAVERRRQRKAKRKEEQEARGRMPFGRRLSCCNCEPIVNKIDQDGLPVTDVDLVTYKDLCQMEQHAHQMRTNHRRRHLDAQSNRNSYTGYTGSCLRRSSLQEESGAYYQLCTSSDEQAIRKKYAWFPPSLKQLKLVDEFFAHFPKEKVPFTTTPTTTTGSTQTGAASLQLVESSDSGQSTASAKSAAGQPGEQAPSQGANSSNSGAPLASSLAGSYRDEQISFQLPRQDISLDYCSYAMSDASRTTYLQFVERRNSQALDVGTVIQIRLEPHANQNPSQPATGEPRQASKSGAQTPLPDAQAMAQRKASTVSQAAVALLAASKGKGQPGEQSQVNTSGPQRCRRCLVRFEDRQLAVMAPNFVIGSTLYRPATLVGPSGARHRRASTAQMEATLAASAASNSLSVFPAPPKASNGSQAPLQSQPANVALFHPNCFTCSTCKEFLVDLVYCLRDCKLYCLRHYGESIRPRCNWCQEVSRSSGARWSSRRRRANEPSGIAGEIRLRRRQPNCCPADQ